MRTPPLATIAVSATMAHALGTVGNLIANDNGTMESKHHLTRRFLLATACGVAVASSLNSGLAAEFARQPGPLEAKDIWTTSDFSFAPGGGGPGGGKDDERLRVGGWGDQYYSLLEFDLTGLPAKASSAVVYLYCYLQRGGGTRMHLDRITEFWDWRTQGTGSDRERLWWADKPATSPWVPGIVPNAVQGQWYALDITTLYNAWQDGTFPNHGVQLRPLQFRNNNFNEFYSSDYTADPSLRPVLVVSDAPPAAPVIAGQPQSQTVAQGATVQISVSTAGADRLFYQWRKDGEFIPGAASATLTLDAVTAANSGSYSVMVLNAAGWVLSSSASLAVLADGASGGQISVMAAPEPPPKPEGTDSVVVVVNGVDPDTEPHELPWVEELASSIQAAAPPNWFVFPYPEGSAGWQTAASAATLITARVQGGQYGRALAQQNWQHVHWIGHGTGAAFLEAAAQACKETAPATALHCTFLDPYPAAPEAGSAAYGKSADWAECYFTRHAAGDWRNRGLRRAHSVEVSSADPNKLLAPRYCQAPGATVSGVPLFDQACGEHPISTPTYSLEFYLASVTGGLPGCASGYGFARSKEGGGWNARDQYPVGNQPTVLCTAEPSAASAALPIQLNAALALAGLPQAASANGVKVDANGFNLTPQSAVWLTLAVTITNPVNTVQFDAGFSGSTPADGFLAVFWNATPVGMLGQGVALPSLDTYRFVLPAIYSNGTYSLSFHLDSGSGTRVSGVTITNIMTGLEGAAPPLRLAMALPQGHATPLLRLTGAPGATYLVERSADLLDWSLAGVLSATDAVVLFADPGAGAATQHFYRARLR
jgi:hypothetical protein